MKKLLVPALAATLLLAACNSTEDATPKEQEQTPATTAPAETPAPTETETPVETPAVTDTEQTPAEEPAKEPVEADTLTTVKIYGPDENFENVVLMETIEHSLQKDGTLTQFILNKLDLTEFYNTHTVSGDEKTIMIDFKESLLASNLVQGSAGGWILSGEIYSSFFETLPTLENIELRVEGKEVELDHISFIGTVKRADYEAVYKAQ